MEELMIHDTYQVIAHYPIDHASMRSIHLLYQPLIGKDATSLYCTLWAELDQMTLTIAPCLHTRLLKITELSLKQISEALRKLEGIGLLKTYCKKLDGYAYVYELKLPLTPNQFFHHQILNTLLYKIVGNEEYQRTKVCFIKNTVDAKGYQDITAKFSEVFSISLLKDTKPLVTKEECLEKEKNVIEKEYQMDLFYEGLKDYQIKKDTITKNDERLIQQLGVLYQINVLDMQGIVKSCIIDDCLNHTQLIHECRAFYDMKMPETFANINHVQSIKHRSSISGSSIDEHIQYLENITPKRLLKEKQGGKEPTRKDLTLIESLMTSLGLEPGVVNVLIEFTLSQCDQTLPRNFMEYYAAKWVRKGILTVKDAMDEARQILIKKEDKPNWVVEQKANEIFTTKKEDDFDEEELQAILAEYD